MDSTFRGKTVTREDVLQAIERFDSEPRNTFAPIKKYSVEHNGKNYPPKDLLRLVIGDVGSFPGGERTNRLFRELGFQIEERGEEMLTAQQVVDDAIEASLSLEADLEEALLPNLAQLEKGLKLYAEQNRFGRQFDAQAAGRIDLLAIDSQQNFVVIELKAGDADRQVCGQIQAYMGWVKANMAGSRNVRGIIVAHEFTERAKLAAAVVPTLSLKKFKINFVFADA